MKKLKPVFAICLITCLSIILTACGKSNKAVGDDDLDNNVDNGIPKYSLIITKSPANAPVTVTGSGSYAVDKTVTVTATNGIFTGWYVNGSSILVSANRIHSFAMLDRDIHLIASCATQYTVEVKVTGGGYVFMKGGWVDTITYNTTSRMFAESETVTLTAKAKFGQIFLGWHRNGVLIWSYETYTLKVPSNNSSLEARFN